MDDRAQILGGRHGDPFAYLGMHPARDGRGVVVRAFVPGARRIEVVALDGDGQEGASVGEDGLFEARIPSVDRPFRYELDIDFGNGHRERRRDPYSFWPMVSGYDQHLFNEGRHHRVYHFLGAHVRAVDGADGVHFAVWAPNAARVSVVGDFNHWDGRRQPMRSMGESGVWELFVPGLGPGARYKYEILTAGGHLLQKADPVAFAAEVPPRTASTVAAAQPFAWTDSAWMEARDHGAWARHPTQQPLAIYEVHAGSWRRGADAEPLGWRDLARQLADYVVDMGFTHVELLPAAEHPFDGSWGYQVTGYFAPTSRFGTPADFAWFVDHLHGRGVGVIVDWVPGHFPADGHGLAQFDGTALYEHVDPKQGAHPDWGTLIFNFGRNEVRSFLLSNALFWLDCYHVDGLRVDAVASMLYLDYSRQGGAWIPNRYGGRENLEAIEFLKEMNRLVYGHHPGALTLAEESTAWPAVSRPTWSGGLGFGFKWNMGWMNDVLRYMAKDPVHRKYNHSDLTFGMLYAYSENFVLPLSHDEVVHGKGSLLSKMPGDEWQRFANLRLLLAYMYAFPGKKLLFMGGEVGQWQEWDHRRSVEWACLEYGPHRGVQSLVRDLNGLYRRHAALHASDSEPAGFAWVDCQDVEGSTLSFERWAPGGDGLVVVCNFTPVPRSGYRVGMPRPGRWLEVVNTDAREYGGSGLGNAGAVTAEATACHGRQWSAELAVPPLAALVLRPDDAPPA